MIDRIAIVMRNICINNDAYSFEQLQRVISKLSRWSPAQNALEDTASPFGFPGRCGRYQSRSYDELLQHVFWGASFVTNSCPVHLQRPRFAPSCQHHRSLLELVSSAEHSTQPTWETAVIVDKFILKTNTLIVIGTSSANKTRVINNPLVMLARFVGRISNTNVSSAFAWMYCVNVRLVSIDEALVAPEAIQKFKNVAGGDNTLIGMKHKASMTILLTHLWFSQQTDHYGKGSKIRLPSFTTGHSVTVFPWRACRRMDID